MLWLVEWWLPSSEPPRGAMWELGWLEKTESLSALPLDSALDSAFGLSVQAKEAMSGGGWAARWADRCRE